MTTRILCVCLGNICRSPMAQGVLERLGREAGLDLEIDSAGLGSWHVGNPPDPRGLTAASMRGYDNSAQRCRQIVEEDFRRFDLIFGMDQSNMERLRRLAPGGARATLRLFHPDGIEIPDPYYGNLEDYDHALDLIEAAGAAIIGELAARRPG